MSIIPAYEAERGQRYRIFPNRYHSQYLEVTVVGATPDQKNLIVEWIDPKYNSTRYFADISIYENLIKVV
jgi:hypothetical protein